MSLRCVQRLGLLEDCPPGRSPRVLDLGCGAGLFLFICKVHGYECLGLDVGDVPLYDDFLKILGVERVDARIEAFGRLPQFESPFDYITAFGTVFNRNGANQWWGEREWEYFIDDVHQYLVPGGRLYMEPNPMGGPAHGERWRSRYTPEVLRTFTGRGAIVGRYGVLFPPKAAPFELPMTVLRRQSSWRLARPLPQSVLQPLRPHHSPQLRPGRLSSLRGLISRARRSALARADRPRGWPVGRRPRRRTAILTRLALSCAALVIGVSCAEMGLRTFDPQELRFRRYSREGVMVFVPGLRGTHLGPKYSSRIETNSDGLRDREYQPGKSKGAFRILVLGDLQTAGLQLPVEETYPKRLESLLASSRSAGRVEVVNAGIPGYGTADELRYLEAFGARWKPDLVVVSFFCGNDLDNNLTEKGLYYEGGNIRVRKKPLTEWQYRIKGLRSWIASHSHLYEFLRDHLRFDDGNAALSPQAGNNHAWVSDLTSTRGWQLTFDLMKQIDEVARGLGARLAVVTIPSPWQNGASSSERGSDTGGTPREGRGDPLLPGQRLCEYASSLQAPCIDLLPGFWDAGPERFRYWKSDYYFTSLGHERAATLLAAFLETRIGSAPAFPHDPAAAAPPRA